MSATASGFVPPPYPHDRLGDLRAAAEKLPGGCVDASVGSPVDPPPAVVTEALATAAAARSYPPSIGSAPYRAAFARWFATALGVELDADAEVAACIGTKELVVGIPHWLRLRSPDRDTVLYPQISYPSYAMGAELAGCRAVPVAVDDQWRLDLASIEDSDAARALCVWVNTPGNPAGALDDLATAAAWGREHNVPVLSDECYVSFTWDGPARTILHHARSGVLALHSLSKRSNMAGIRAGAYAGDPELVSYLREVRKHAGMMVPGPVQAAAVAAWGDEDHVAAQRKIYLRRLGRLAAVLSAAGYDAALPQGAFYLWVRTSGGGWDAAARLASEIGLLVSPGELYGHAGADHIRVSATVTDEAISLLEERVS